MAGRWGREAARGSTARRACGGHVHAGLPSVQSSGGLMPGNGNYSPNESQEEAPPEQGAAAAFGAVLLGQHKVPLVPPAIHVVQHERAGRESRRIATGSTAGLPLPE